jgi:ornithine carbamoyltransferase
MSMKGLYKLSELSSSDVEVLVARALALRRGSRAQRFPGRAIGLLFLSPSLRTQASFQRAASRLSLDTVLLNGGANGVWALETRDGAVMDGAAVEHVREAAAVLGRFVDLLAVRAFAGGTDLALDRTDPVLSGFRAHAGVPIVNMESALWHPCQALADWATLDMLGVPRQGKLVLTWAWHPKALPHAVPNSTLTMAAQRGMHVTLLRPQGYDLHPEVMQEAQRLAAKSGGSVRVGSDRAELEGAHVVYAKSWGSLDCYGNAAAESALRAPLRTWRVDNSWMANARPGAHFMHCLPVRRNVVVADEVLDSRASVVIDQAENRLHAQSALLEALCIELETRGKVAPEPASLVAPRDAQIVRTQKLEANP